MNDEEDRKGTNVGIENKTGGSSTKEGWDTFWGRVDEEQKKFKDSTQNNIEDKPVTDKGIMSEIRKDSLVRNDTKSERRHSENPNNAPKISSDGVKNIEVTTRNNMEDSIGEKKNEEIRISENRNSGVDTEIRNTEIRNTENRKSYDDTEQRSERSEEIPKESRRTQPFKDDFSETETEGDESKKNSKDSDPDNEECGSSYGSNCDDEDYEDDECPSEEEAFKIKIASEVHKRQQALERNESRKNLIGEQFDYKEEDVEVSYYEMDEDDHEVASSPSFSTETIQESPWTDEEIPYKSIIETNYHGEGFTILQKHTYRLLSEKVNKSPDALRTLSDEDSKLFKSSKMINQNILMIQKDFDDVMCLLIKITQKKNTNQPLSYDASASSFYQQ